MNIPKLLALLVVLSAGALIIPGEVSAQKVSVSYQQFYDELSPHGMWVDYPHHGYVWMPGGEPGFTPYASDGHWVFTNDGWTWVSDYPWGWATFHYGRWGHDVIHGWFWVPGNEWAPAWVSWRRSPGYYGWAPLRPGVSISDASDKAYHDRQDQWIFVKEKDITRTDVSHHYIDRAASVTIMKNSTVIVNTRKGDKGNVSYIAGPEKDEVEKATRTQVKSIAIREHDKPGSHLSNDELKIYKPDVQDKGGDGKNPAPAQVTKLSNVKAASEKASQSKGTHDKQGKEKQGEKK